jgi:hypothetical protein
VFSSNPVKPHLSFAVAIRGQAASHPQQEVAANSTTSAPKAQDQTIGQSVQATPVNSDTQEMMRACTLAQQIMAEIKDAASEEAKFLALATFVYKFMKHNGK